MPASLDKTAQFGFANPAAAQTDSVLVAANPNTRIRVIGFLCTPGATPPSTVVFNSKGSGAGTAISASIPLTANQPVGISVAECGICQTNKGEALTVTTGAGTLGTGITFVYQQVF